MLDVREGDLPETAPRYRLYAAPYSVNCHGPWMLLQWLADEHGAEHFDIAEVDIINAGQLQPELTRLNPNHSVPTLYDSSVEKVIWESNAILRYLARQAGTAADLYPVDDPLRAARVEAALEFRSDVLYPAIEDFSYVALGFSRRRIAAAPRAMVRALEELILGFLSGPDPFIGGQSPGIADFAIAPSLAFLGDENDDQRLPQTIRDYLARFYQAVPGALSISEQARAYVRMRAEMGYVAGRPTSFRDVLKEPDDVRPPFARPDTVATARVTCADDLEGRAVRLYLALTGAEVDVLAAPDSVLRWRPVLEDDKSGIAVSGAFTIARCLGRGAADTDSDVPEQAERSADFMHRLRRETESALSGSVEALEQLPALLRVLDAQLESDSSPFLAGKDPGMQDCMAFLCLRALPGLSGGSIPIRLSPVASTYLKKLDDSLGAAAAQLAVAATGASSVVHEPKADGAPGEGGALRSLIDSSRWGNLDLEHEGPLNDQIYRERDSLPPSHAAWDEAAANLHLDYRNLKVRERMDTMPVLSAAEQDLPERYLARASSLLSIFAHAYWHNEHNDPVEAIPESLSKPWLEVTRRLGRSAPTMNYMDLYTYNWYGVPNSVTRMRLRTPTTGSAAEQRFYLGTVAISYAGLPILELAARAADEAGRADELALTRTLGEITQCVKRMIETFQFLSLQRNDVGFVDPVIWTHTVATFAMTFTQNVGLGEAVAPSGNSLPIIHYLDSFLGRKTYGSELGQLTQGFRDPAVMAPNHIACIQKLSEVRVRDFVSDHARDPATRRAWNDLIKVYAGEHGFLKQHMKKVFGFVFTASLVGRPATLLNIPLSILKFVESTDNVTQLLVSEMGERRHLALETDNARSVMPAAKPRVPPAEDDPRPVFNDFEMALRNTPDQGFWMLIGHDVVDVTPFLWQHPGGSHTLEYMAGLDATHVYDVIHPNKPIPADWKVGIYRAVEGRDDALKLVQLLTLCMNVCQIEFRSIGGHWCAGEPHDAFDSRPPLDPNWKPHVSPVNLMLLLRYFRKVFDQLFMELLDGAKPFLGEAPAGEIAGDPDLLALRAVRRVPDALRLETMPPWVGEELQEANRKLVELLDKMRRLIAADGFEASAPSSQLGELMLQCAKQAGRIARVYSVEGMEQPGSEVA